MKAFVTGAGGFVGSALVVELLARGHHVRALTHSTENGRYLSARGAQVVRGDVTDVTSMRRAMQGCDVVFHVAGYVEIGQHESETIERVNVGGTRKVLRLAVELGIPRIVFTSTTEVFGDTEGILVDETIYREQPSLTEHARTKWLAHYQVAVPFIERGAPVIIVMPGAIYGPGGHGIVTDLMRAFQRGYPVVAGADTVLTFAHVQDIAQGHILAAQKGRIGETYVLSGPAVSLGEMLDFWSQLTGKRAPSIRLPAAAVRALLPLFVLWGRYTGLRSIFSREGAAIAGATLTARSDKARRELGWKTRPLQGGMLETLAWVAADDAARIDPIREREKRLGLAILAAAVLLALGWLWSRLTRRQ
ncbi:MAG: NAD-dependent epimerase/dehydratase family protein [Candidatus Promineifilaceae bacterium]